MPRRVPLLVVLALLLSGCGIDEDVVAREAAEAGPTTTTGTTATTAPEPSPPASPFTVEEVPEGYGLVVEGTGEDDPADVVPVTVLAPDGVPVGPDVILVEAVDDDEEDADDAGRWTSLAEDGLRAWGVEATEDDLGAVLAAMAAPTADGGAPVVAGDPPGDLETVGSLTGDGVVALRAAVPIDADAPVPGPPSAQVAAWSTSDGGSLLVMNLPAGALDPAAVATEVRPPRRVVDQERDAVAEEVAVDDATGIVTTTARSDTGAVVRRELAVPAQWGDVLLVVSRGPEVLDADALVALAESVTPT